MSLQIFARQEKFKECKNNMEKAQPIAKPYQGNHQTPSSFEIGENLYLRVGPNNRMHGLAQFSAIHCIRVLHHSQVAISEFVMTIMLLVLQIWDFVKQP